MSLIPPHPLELELAAMPQCTTAEERLEVVWKHYEQETRQPLDRPVSIAQQEQVRDWLVKHPDGLGTLAVKERVLRHLVAVDIASKASSAVQLACLLCEIDSDSSSSPAVNIFLPVRVMPWSAQSSSENNKVLKAKVTADLKAKGMVKGIAGSRPICVSISSVVPPKQRKKDVDNLVKGLLDSLTSVLYEDDRHVQCLTTRRFEYSGTEGFYLVRARTVRPWDADVVSPGSTRDPLFPGQNLITI